tara:strand:- start:7736 stop:9112 length:1377 start_codon:yes stop_codon:yes gene_type:complete
MREMLFENKVSRIVGFLYFINLSLYLLFGRPYSGLYFSSFRLGELLIGFFLLLNLLILFLPVKYLKTNINYNDQIIYVYKLIILSFFIVLLLNNGDITNLYSYKSSSYIWMAGALMFSSYLVENIFNKKMIFIMIVFYLVYQFSTIHYPESLISFFETYSDKFDFQKGSDLLIIYVVSILFIQRNMQNKFTAFAIFLTSSSILLPLFLFKSKGAFLPAIIFIIYYLYLCRRIMTVKIMKTLAISFLSLVLFIVSTFEVYGNLNFKKMGMDGYNSAEELSQLFTFNELDKGLTAITTEKNTDKFFLSFFVMDGRLYSREMMANWRLEIWQDILRDLNNENRFLKGYGYNEIIPAMDLVHRRGTDGTNENPHNFLFYILARGGLIQLLLFSALYIQLIIFYYKKFKNLNILIYLIPILTTSLFDASMESIRFPLIFYSFLSYFMMYSVFGDNLSTMESNE